MKILRKVLNIAPYYRYGDELTTKMFRTNSWRKLGSCPTAQNPFSSYNSPFFIMLLGWFLRSKRDYFLTKLFLFTKGKTKRQRLFNTFDHKKCYSFPMACDNFQSYFPGIDFCDFSEICELFKKRMNKESWPLSSMDLMPFAQAMYYIIKFR
jgi:hypothetical protein